MPTEYRIRIARLIENMTGGTALVGVDARRRLAQAQRIMILRQANLPQKAKLAKRLAGIPGLGNRV